MGFEGWFSENWFNLLSTVGIVGSLSFTAVSLRKETRTRRVANLLALTQNHRELWQGFYCNPNLARVLNSATNLTREPATGAEHEFVNLVIQHLSGVYRAMCNDLTIKPEGIHRDVREFFRLPIPRFVWGSIKELQDQDFVRFVEDCLAGG